MLPRPQRLVSAADHRLVARRGRRGRRGSVGVKCVLAEAGQGQVTRLAVVVPKLVGSAPVRNRVRRRLQNLSADYLAELPVGSLVVVRAEAGVTTMNFAELGASLAAALTAATRSSAGRPA